MLVAFPTIFCVSHAEKLLIDTLVHYSSSHERQVATRVSLISQQLRTGDVGIRGIDTTPEALASAEGKAFVAIFSRFVALSPDVSKIIMSDLDKRVESLVTQRLGSPDQLWHEVFIPSLNGLKQTYDKFRESVIDPYRKNINAIQSMAEKAWQDYVSELKAHGKKPSSVPQWMHSKVVSSVQNKGIPVPNDWDPNDKQTFTNAIQKKEREHIASQFRSMMEKYSNFADLPLEGFEDFDSFLLHPAVQKQWRESIKAPDVVMLKNGTTAIEFKQKIYTPWHSYLINQQKQIIQADSYKFGNGGEYETLGKDALRASIVPLLALLFSLLGMIIHICKTGYYSLRILLPWVSLATLLNATLFLVLLATPLFLTNSITQSAVFNRVENNTSLSHPFMAKLSRWIIQGQAYTYPVNNWIRIHVLHGTTFDRQIILSHLS